LAPAPETRLKGSRTHPHTHALVTVAGIAARFVVFDRWVVGWECIISLCLPNKGCGTRQRFWAIARRRSKG